MILVRFHDLAALVSFFSRTCSVSHYSVESSHSIALTGHVDDHHGACAGQL